MFMVMPQFRVTWKAPLITETGASARSLSDGTLVVSQGSSYPTDVERLVHILMANGYEDITVARENSWGNQQESS